MAKKPINWKTQPVPIPPKRGLLSKTTNTFFDYGSARKDPYESRIDVLEEALSVEHAVQKSGVDQLAHCLSEWDSLRSEIGDALAGISRSSRNGLRNFEDHIKRESYDAMMWLVERVVEPVESKAEELIGKLEELHALLDNAVQGTLGGLDPDKAAGRLRDDYNLKRADSILNGSGLTSDKSTLENLALLKTLKALQRYDTVLGGAEAWMQKLRRCVEQIDLKLKAAADESAEAIESERSRFIEQSEIMSIETQRCITLIKEFKSRLRRSISLTIEALGEERWQKVVRRYPGPKRAQAVIDGSSLTDGALAERTIKELQLCQKAVDRKAADYSY